MSFSFVDRITELEPGRRARGTFMLRRSVSSFPCWLLAEATGQLAAWLAIASADFLRRPVAALTQQLTLGITPPCSAEVDLAVEIERLDPNVVVYGGAATVGGATVLALNRCLGPMLATEDFDDPRQLRARFARLCASGEEPRNFHGGDWKLASSPLDGEPGVRRAAILVVPANAPFFADHFPRKRVLPATLLLEALTQLALELAEEAMRREGRTSAVRPRALRRAKMRSFVHPGDELTVGAEVLAVRDSAAEILVHAERGGNEVASARVEVGIGIW